MQIKAGKIELDERVLVDKFVKATKLQGDNVHIARALAMKCEVNARLCHFETAVATISLLENVYDADSHHEGICKAYGSDRAAQAFSAAIFWNRQMGRREEGKRLQDFVVNDLLPKMDPKNVHNSGMLLLPVIKTMKQDREYSEAKHLFGTYVVQKFNRYFGDDGTTPLLSMHKPIMCLLSAYIDGENMADLTEMIEWAAEDDNGTTTDFLEGLITSMVSTCCVSGIF